MRSLRARLILSHVLPLLVVLTVVGLLLTYLLETQVFLAQASNELERQAVLVADVAADYPSIWTSRTRSQAFLDLIGESLPAQAMLLAPDGTLLASNQPSDELRLGEVLAIPGLDEVVRTGAIVRVDYGEQSGTGAADVLVPVILAGRVRGVLRLTDPLSTVYERFSTTRRTIVAVLAGGLVLGGAMGLVLAVGLERPLRRATRAIGRMAAGRPLERLPEQGPEDIRLLLRAFNTLTEQLQSLERSRKRLLANLVHELGRPLGAILAAIQAQTSGAVGDEQERRELLEGMEAEVGRMRRVLDDLTRLYDRSVGALELDRQPTDLGAWLTQALGPWREAAQDKGLTWHADLGPLPSVAIDPDRLGQALGNVVSNAIKYTPRGGSVSVRACAVDGEARIVVEDSGPGIPPEERDQVFAPFYRGQTGARFPQGMGLGLSIARDLVAAHGGSLRVDGERGAAFTISLPVAPVPGDRPADAPGEGHAP
jgi:two-component system sensor histidine kinase BaeS